MSDWSRGAANKLRERVQREDNESAILVEKRKLLDEQGPGLWQQICEDVKKLCKELNADYGQDIAVVEACSVRDLKVELRHAGNMSELKANFTTSTSPDALKWSYAGPAARMGRGGQYSLYVDAGRVSFQNSVKASTPESIAKEMLDGLLQE
jgi:hypothetical protein